MLKTVRYKDIASFTWHYWKRQPLLLFGTISLMILHAFLDSLFPLVTGQLIDKTVLSLSAPEKLWGNILPTLILFLTIEVVFQISYACSIYFWNRFASRNLYNIANDSFRKVQRFSSDWHNNTFAGGTVRKITRGMTSFDVYEDILFRNALPAFVVFVFIVTFMWIRWPVMGMLALGMSVIFFAVSVYTSLKWNAPRFVKSAARDTRIGASLADTITANATVKSFGAEKREDKRFERVVRSWRIRVLNSWHMGNTTDLLRRGMMVVNGAVSLFAVLYFVERGEATAGDIIFVMNSFWLVAIYLRTLGEQLVNLQKAVSEIEDVVVFWQREDKLQDKEGAQPIEITEAKIDLNDVHFMYEGQDQNLFKGLSLSIAPGEKIALVGPSGSGKSTFVKLVQRLYDVESGEVLISGQNIADVTQESLRQNIALVPQDPILFHRSIAANIAYARPRASQEEIIAAAKKAYAHEFIQDLPNGYDTLVGERGVKLSGGERQRVAIARAILADAPILILDEATSSLDSVSEHFIQKALENLTRGKTTITVAHRLSTIKDADRILVFAKGQIVEQGTHHDLVQKDGSTYRKLYEMQAFEFIDDEKD